MEAVATRANESQQIGVELNQFITTPGIKLNDLREELDGLRQQAAQVLAGARELDPPGPLREEQSSLVQALEFRVSGLDGLRQAFAQVQGTREAGEAGARLAIPTQRLIASDVIYQDLFYEGSRSVMSNEDVQGIPIPESKFVQNADLASPTQWTLIVERLTRPSAGGG